MPINFAVKLAATVALEAVQIGLQATRKTRGPRLSETQVTTADYGTPLPRFLGMRRFAGQIIWSRDLEVVEKTHKIKGGGKQTTESALWTAGVAFADCRGGPIDKVLKIWLDETLAYDATGAGPPSYASTLGIDLASVLRIYTGTNDQAADAAYEDYCEERYGAGTATAFRGTAMLVFDRMPCDNFGNRPPQISVLATSSAADHFPYAQVPCDLDASATFSVSPSGSWMVRWSPGEIEFWDLPTRTLINTVTVPFPITGTYANVAVSDVGKAYVVGPWVVPTAERYSVITSGGAATATTLDGPSDAFSGTTRALSRILTGLSTGYLDGTAYVAGDAGRDFCVDAAGELWGVFQPTGSSNQFSLVPITGAGGGIYTGLVSRSGPSPARICHAEAYGHFVVTMDGKFYLIDYQTFTITSSGTAAFGAAELPYGRPAAKTFWSGYDEYSLEDCSLVRSVNPNDWLVEAAGAGGTAYDPVSDAIMEVPNGANHVTWRPLNRSANAGVTLGAIVSAMCDTASLTDRSTASLTQSVSGYSWTRGDVKSQMEPLLDIHDVKARPHDFEIEFLPSGSSPSGSITTAEFAKNGPRYKLTERQDTDLPKLIRVNFADSTFDQQTNNVLSPLPIDAIDSQRDEVIDLTTYSANPDEAQKLSDRYMRRQWNSRDGVENSLTARQLAFEPGDVTILDLDGIQWTARLDKQTFVGSRMDCSWVRDESIVADLNDQTTGPPMDGRDGETIVIPAPVQGFVIDTGLREDADDDIRPVLYAGAGAFSGLPYPGATIYEATGAGDSLAYDQLFETVTTGATWGMCIGTLGEVPSPWLWDRGNTLDVSLQSGSLTSVTEDDINLDPALNLLLVGSSSGWEYVNFTTATLNGDGTYTLSGFKRGRRGTEWVVHAAHEVFVMASDLELEEMGSDDIGDDLSFKAQSVGRLLETAEPIDLTFTGASLKPYAPCVFTAQKQPNGDWLFSWIRRTRVGGRWVDGTITPLSEATEAYELEVGDRLFSVTSSEATWTVAMQTTDFGAEQSAPPTSTVYQISAAVGRGYPQSDLRVLDGVSAGSPTFRVRPMTNSFNDEIHGLVGTGHDNASADGTNHWLSFDGNNDYVGFANDTLGQQNVTDEWTLECHIDPTALPASTAGLVNRNSGGNTRYYLQLLSTGAVLFGAAKFGGTLLQSSAGAMTLAGGHIAVTVNSSDLWTLWIEGVAVDTETWAARPDDSTGSNLAIGADSASLGTTYYNGKIGRVKITPECLYTGSFTPPSRATV